MDKLYHKHTLPSGRVRYIESYEWDTGDPAEGLWVIRRGGQSKTWLTNKMADLPGVKPEGAWIAGQLDTIAKVVLEHRDASAYETAIAIVNTLWGEV